MLKTSSTRVHYVSQIVKNNNNAYLTARVRCILFYKSVVFKQTCILVQFCGKQTLHRVEFALVQPRSNNSIESHVVRVNSVVTFCSLITANIPLQVLHVYSDAGVSAACSFCPFSCATSPDCYK